MDQNHWCAIIKMAQLQFQLVEKYFIKHSVHTNTPGIINLGTFLLHLLLHFEIPQILLFTVHQWPNLNIAHHSIQCFQCWMQLISLMWRVKCHPIFCTSLNSILSEHFSKSVLLLRTKKMEMVKTITGEIWWVENFDDIFCHTRTIAVNPHRSDY